MPNTFWHGKDKPNYDFPFEERKSTLSAQYAFRANNVVAVDHQPEITPKTVYVANRYQPVEIFPGVFANLSGIAENSYYTDYLRLLLWG